MYLNKYPCLKVILTTKVFSVFKIFQIHQRKNPTLCQYSFLINYLMWANGLIVSSCVQHMARHQGVNQRICTLVLICAHPFFMTKGRSRIQSFYRGKMARPYHTAALLSRPHNHSAYFMHLRTSLTPLQLPMRTMMTLQYSPTNPPMTSVHSCALLV